MQKARRHPEGLRPLVGAWFQVLFQSPHRGTFQRSVALLIRFRSPLLTESLLLSFPPGTEMFQFPGFASRTYAFST